MNDIVHTLILEDNIEKAELLVFQLQSGGFNVDYLSVNNAETMLAALQQKNWDMILVRYARPGFNGIKAFRLLKQQGLRIPLIIFAETLDEAEVVESMKAGAEDYISRQNQSRLVALINRIKNQSKENKVEKSNESSLKEGSQKYLDLLDEKQFLDGVFSGIQDGLVVMDIDLTIQLVNPTISRWYPDAGPLVGKKCYEVFRNSRIICEGCPNLDTIRTGQSAQEIIPRKNGGGETTGWLEIYNFPFTKPDSGEVKGVIQYMRDITGRKKAEDESHRLTEKLKANAISARQMSSLLDVHLLSRQVVDPLQEITGCYSTNLFTLQDDYLVLTTSRGGIAKKLPLGFKLPV